MERYFLEISYDGTAYSGWQRQISTKTIQGEIERALEILFRSPVLIMGAGRTDAGVHAVKQFAHADLPEIISDYDSTLKSLNGILPHDIRISRIIQVHGEAHARFDAAERQYRYQLACERNIFDDRYTWILSAKPDFITLHRLAAMVLGDFDFASFSKKSADVLHTRCVVSRSEFIQTGDGRFTYHIQANRFLHHMVRSLVGSMIQVATGKRNFAEFARFLNEPNHKNHSFTAPAHALFLQEVTYPQDYFSRVE